MTLNILGKAKDLEYRIAKTVLKKKNKIRGLILRKCKTYEVTVN